MVARSIVLGASWGGSTNLLTQPKAFDHADWLKSNCTADDDFGGQIDPDGTNLSEAIIEASDTNQFHEVTQTLSKDASSIAYTLSVYARTHPSDTRNRISLQLDDSAGNGRACIVDLVNGEELGVAPFGYGTGFGDGTVTVTAAANGWYLCTFAGVTTNSSTTLRVIFAIDALSTTAAAGTQYNGNGTSGVLLYNAVLTED
jgi:hypothetical protein